MAQHFCGPLFCQTTKRLPCNYINILYFICLFPLAQTFPLTCSRFLYFVMALVVAGFIVFLFLSFLLQVNVFIFCLLSLLSCIRRSVSRQQASQRCAEGTDTESQQYEKRQRELSNEDGMKEGRCVRCGVGGIKFHSNRTVVNTKEHLIDE
uniref:Uncharacterized protein n=1 Tax=Trypanosoma vivax (strain Y486) TaxID=1055687 RepID=G0UAV7_TRYVY|nr:hypothetical protein, unlikely [Trypanosoma vivax Y486]